MTRSHQEPIRLALVEDHTLVRLSLKALLGQSGTIKVVGDTGSAATALQQTMAWAPDVVLMDVQLPDGNGVTVCRKIRDMRPATQVVFLSAYDDQETVAAAAAGGAAGFLHKTTDAEQMIRAIHAVAEGKAFLDNRATVSLLQRLRSTSEPECPCSEDNLSPQECRVMQLLTEGYTNKEIAARMNLSDKTIKNYLSHVFEKMHVTRRSAAVTTYLKMRKSHSVPPWMN